MDKRFEGIVSEDNGGNEKDEEEWITSEGNQVKKFIKNIEENTKTLDKQIKGIMTEVNSTVSEKKNKQIMETISQTQDVISKAKQKLDQMAELNKSMEKSSKVVMRENMHRSLTKQLIDTVGQFNAYHAQFQQYTDQKLTREIKIVKPETTEEEIEDIKKKIQNGEGGGAIFAQTFVSEEHTKARERLRYYRDRKSVV